MVYCCGRIGGLVMNSWGALRMERTEEDYAYSQHGEITSVGIASRDWKITHCWCATRYLYATVCFVASRKVEEPT